MGKPITFRKCREKLLYSKKHHEKSLKSRKKGKIVKIKKISKETSKMCYSNKFRLNNEIILSYHRIRVNKPKSKQKLTWNKKRNKLSAYFYTKKNKW